MFAARCLLWSLIFSATFGLSSLSADTKPANGKKDACRTIGFFDKAADCGTRRYARVFTGTVKSVIEASDSDKVLTLLPEEVFVGDPVGEVEAAVNQGCLPGNKPEIQVGDRWLFYLESYGFGPPDHNAKELILPLYSPSKPISEAQDDIETLRRLARLTDTAIITGEVDHIGPTYDKLNPTPIPNRRIAAKSATTGLEYTTFTNSSGHYTFEVPPGSYEVTANTEPGFREVENEFAVASPYIANGACLDIDFQLLVDGKLAGRVTRADGKPASSVILTILRTDPVGAPATVVTDAAGDFELSGRQPGSYIIGIGLLAPFDSEEWKSRVYYPGVRTKDEATIIQLGKGEWRTDINFVLPPGSTPR